MAYNFDVMSQQLQDLQRQYQELSNYQQPKNTMQPIIPPQLSIPSRQVQYVEGLDGARLYQQNLPSNSSEIIMDKEENLFYYVSKDANGTPAKRIPVGHFTIEEVQQEEPMFLTRKDFDDFKEEIRQMFASTQSQPTTQKTVSSTTKTSSSTKKE